MSRKVNYGGRDGTRGATYDALMYPKSRGSATWKPSGVKEACGLTPNVVIDYVLPDHIKPHSNKVPRKSTDKRRKYAVEMDMLAKGWSRAEIDKAMKVHGWGPYRLEHK